MGGILQNVSIPWFCCTSVIVWFLFFHALPVIIVYHEKILSNMPLVYHLVGAYVVCIVAITNPIMTPSSSSRIFHVWFGRIGCLAGCLVFGTGLLLSWNHRSIPLPFALGITIGGVATIWFEYMGWRAILRYRKLQKEIQELQSQPQQDCIVHVDGDNHDTRLQNLVKRRDDALRRHIVMMVCLFTVGCGCPAFLRFAALFFPNYMLLNLIASYVVMPTLLVWPLTRIYTSKMDTSGAEGISNHVIDTTPFLEEEE